MTSTEVLIGALMLVGIVGTVVPLLPGPALVALGLIVWAVTTGGGAAWAVTVAGLLLLVAGAVVKYLVPGRRLEAAGVPRRTLLVGAGLGVIGFFVVPVIGLPLGFILGVWLAEGQRLGRDAAWPSTLAALRAVGLSILIELTAVLLAVALWVVGVILT